MPSRFFSFRLPATLALLLIAGPLHAADIFVAPSGNDTSGNGSPGAPFRTIQRAANSAVAGDTVLIRAGTYRETVRPARSGTAGSPILYKAYESDGVFEEVIISGADVVAGWTPHDTANGRAIYRTTAMNWNLSNTGASFGTIYRNQIFVNGRMQVLARWPNVPAERITRLTYQDLALVSAASGKNGVTATSAWLENTQLGTTFPADYWTPARLATARVFLSPATMIWGMSVKIASQSANRLNLDAAGTGFDFTTAYYYPTTNNRFFLYDWYDALDTAGEYWKDTASNTLYLWAPDGAHPATLTVEARRRDFGLSLGQRSHLTFQGIKLFACTVESDAASNFLTFSEIEARYLGHIDNYAVTFSTAANPREFYLRGNGHIVRDSYFNGSAVTAIGASGTNIRIENNVIRDFGYAHHGPAILARQGALYGNRTLATKNQFLRNTVFNGGHTAVTTDPALDVKYNRIHHSHLRGSDVGAIGIASTDGLGSEIAYNVVSDIAAPKDNGVLYGGFGIYFDYECRNYTVHHNLVYDTTGSSYQLMPSRAAQLPGVTDLGMKFYHNTGDGDFGLIEPQDIPGVDVRNNLVRRFLNAGNGTYANNLPNVQFSHNTAYGAAAPFRDRLNHDLRFATASSPGVNAGTVISPFTDGFVGVAPDTGALEFDLAPFIAGATVTPRQLPSLTATKLAQNGEFVDLQLGNLPEGRSPPNTLQARIGSGAFGGTLAYDYPTETWRLLGVDKGSLTGVQTIEVRLESGATTATLDSIIDVGSGVPAPEIAVRGNEVNILDGDTTPSGTDHTTFADTQAGDPVGSTQTYTIHNFGSLTLEVGAITFTGTHAADFSVATSPATAVAPGAITAFTVRFKPTATGLRTATLHIANNDADEADFDFAIQGQGTTPLPELNLPSAQLTATTSSQTPGSIALPLQNIGLADLTWSLSASTAGLYSWADSASGGPAYAWYDIAALGTRHWGGGSNDDESTLVTLPFTFPFYGSSFTQLTLGTNGILSPGAPSSLTAVTNYPLPSASAPPDLIAAFWDDLLVDGEAQVRSHAVDATTFVVLYENLKSFNTQDRVTFQIVLRSNGRITIQYRDNQFTRSYTIGLQNAAKTFGPQVVYSDGSGAIQGAALPVGTGIDRALTFYPPSTFVTGFSPASGTIAAGSDTSPLVYFNSGDLAAGSHSAILTLTTNDADEPSVQIQLTLDVLAVTTPAITDGLILHEPFAYAIGTRNPDPDAGLNSDNGLPATNVGGSPSGTGTGLRGVWGTTTDVATGLTYTQGDKTLVTSGGAARVNNATWGGNPYLYRNMATDPFLAQRIGSTSTGNLGVDGTSLYVSLLGQTSSATADAFRFSFKYDGSVNLFLTNTSTGWALNHNGAGNTVATGPGTSLVLNTPTLFILRFDFAAGAADTVGLWINPPLGQALGAPHATLSGLNFPGLGNFQTRAAVADAMCFDEFRVGTSLAAVTPHTEPPPPDALAAFRTTHGLAADGSEDLATPAGDGVPNLLKYAFNLLGSSPGQAPTLDAPNASVLAPEGSAGLPAISLTPSFPHSLRVTFIRRKASAYPGITYAVEFSDTLAADSWAANPSATESTTSLDETFERVIVTDSLTAPARRFARVQISTP